MVNQSVYLSSQILIKHFMPLELLLSYPLGTIVMGRVCSPWFISHRNKVLKGRATIANQGESFI